MVAFSIKPSKRYLKLCELAKKILKMSSPISLSYAHTHSQTRFGRACCHPFARAGVVHWEKPMAQHKRAQFNFNFTQFKYEDQSIQNGNVSKPLLTEKKDVTRKANTQFIQKETARI